MQNKLNEEFFKEMLSDVPKGGVVLCVYFASDTGDVDKKFVEDEQRLKSYVDNKNVSFLKATEADFENQVKKSDVIFLRGGDTELLLLKLREYPKLKELLVGKTVAGSSAGAYALSKYYYSKPKDLVREGLGLLPVRTVCHYQSLVHPVSKNINPVGDIKKFDNKLELVVLKDYEYKVFHSEFFD